MTIAHAISIVNDGVGTAGVIVPSGGTGVTINAGTNDAVSLRGLTIEGAVLSLKSFAFDHGRIQSAGSLTDVSLAHLQELRHEITGEPPAVRTDLVFDGDWDFSLGATASSRSIQTASAFDAAAFSIIRGFDAGTSSTDRSNRAEGDISGATVIRDSF